jgi:hypothetical protein
MIHPKNANAVVVIGLGVGFSGAASITTGGYIVFGTAFGTSAALGSVAIFVENQPTWVKITEGTAAVLIAAAGGLLLDDHSDSSVLFLPLSTDDAAKLNATSEQMKTYNSEVVQLNAVRETIVAETLAESAASFPGATTDPSLSARRAEADQMAAYASSRWEFYSDSFSPDTRLIAREISENFVK